MDAQLKTKWVEALRSGEYKQGQSMLHNKDDDSYCCLGVLCKVVGATFGRGAEQKEDDEGFSYQSEYDYVPVLDGRVLSSSDDEELKPSFCREVGIPDQFVLIKMNDGALSPGDKDHVPPLPFSEIADYIEANL